MKTSKGLYHEDCYKDLCVKSSFLIWVHVLKISEFWIWGCVWVSCGTSVLKGCRESYFVLMSDWKSDWAFHWLWNWALIAVYVHTFERKFLFNVISDKFPNYLNTRLTISSMFSIFCLFSTEYRMAYISLLLTDELLTKQSLIGVFWNSWIHRTMESLGPPCGHCDLRKWNWFGFGIVLSRGMGLDFIWLDFFVF